MPALSSNSHPRATKLYTCRVLFFFFFVPLRSRVLVKLASPLVIDGVGRITDSPLGCTTCSWIFAMLIYIIDNNFSRSSWRGKCLVANSCRRQIACRRVMIHDPSRIPEVKGQAAAISSPCFFFIFTSVRDFQLLMVLHKFPLNSVILCSVIL